MLTSPARGNPTPRETPAQLARQIDPLLRVLARDDVLVERAIGKGLVRMAGCDGFAALGYSCLENYASQQLGISGRSAQELAWMERRLARYPAVAGAFDRGELSFSHVRLLLRAVRSQDEMLWAWASERLCVAELDLALQHWTDQEGSPPSGEEVAGHPVRAPEEEPPDHRITCIVTPGVLLKLDLAVDIARRANQADLSVGACMEYFLAEFLNGAGAAALADVPDDDDDAVPGEVLPWRVPRVGAMRRMLREIHIGAAEFTEHWAALGRDVPRIPGPQGFDGCDTPADLDRWMVRIKHLAREREIHLMNMLAIVSSCALHDALDFYDFRQYVEDRLGMSFRTASFLVSLHRRLARLPVVADAFKAGRLTRAQAWELTRVATPAFEGAWVAHAQATTLKFLRQDVASARRFRDLDPEWFTETGGIPPASREAKSRADEQPPSTARAPRKASIAADLRAAGAMAHAPDARLGDAFHRVTAHLRAAGAREAVASASCGSSTIVVQICAPTSETERLPVPRPRRAPGDGTPPPPESNPAPTADNAARHPAAIDDDPPGRRPADVAWLPMRERLHLYRRGELDDLRPGPASLLCFNLPAHLKDLWREGYRACSALYGHEVTVADFIEIIVDAFLAEYAAQTLEDIRRHKIIHRDGWVCANPTCTRRGDLHEHHVTYRSHGGSSDEGNLITLCRQCHLRLLHEGRLRVKGVAPHGLTWQLGATRNGDVHLEVVGRRIAGGAAVSLPQAS